MAIRDSTCSSTRYSTMYCIVLVVHLGVHTTMHLVRLVIPRTQYKFSYSVIPVYCHTVALQIAKLKATAHWKSLKS
jgi:hypothetical protein